MWLDFICPCEQEWKGWQSRSRAGAYLQQPFVSITIQVYVGRYLSGLHPPLGSSVPPECGCFAG